jgi:hypothetical protein
MDKYERYEAEQKRNQNTTASKGAHGPGVLIGVICLGLLMYVRLNDDLPDGSNCVVSESTYGVRDLDKTDEALARAQKVNDQFGIAELVQHGAAGMVPEGTRGLVIDSESHFLEPFVSYRRIRILDGDYMGKALWFKKSVLRLAEPSPGPCPDPHARRGTTGNCFCEPGWNYDPTTLKCVQ